MHASTEFNGLFPVSFHMSFPELLNLREDLWDVLGEDGHEDHPTLNSVLVEVAGLIQLVEKGHTSTPV